MNKYIEKANVANQSTILHLADFCLIPLRTALKGPSSESHDGGFHKIGAVALPIIAAIFAIVFFPITLAALAVKWLKRDEWLNSKDEESKGHDEKGGAVVKTPFSLSKPVISQKECHQKLHQDLSQVHALDQKLGAPTTGSWRKLGAAHEEINQTLEIFRDSTKCMA